MNRRQLRLMWIGIVLVAAMILCPPWKTSGGRVIGYRLLLNPPTSHDTWTFPTWSIGSGYRAFRVDYPRLALQLVIVVLVLGGLALTPKAKLQQKLPKRTHNEHKLAHTVAAAALALGAIVIVWTALAASCRQERPRADKAAERTRRVLREPHRRRARRPRQQRTFTIEEAYNLPPK